MEKYNRDDISESIKLAVERSKTLAEAQRNFFPKMNIKTFKKICKELGIFSPNQGKRGTTLEDFPDLMEVRKNKFLLSLEENKFFQSSKLSKYLLRYGIKNRECEICGLSLWNGREIPIEVHHKDGNKFNNSLDNLAMVCPNCHAQTETYKSKNKTYKNNAELAVRRD